MADRTTLTSMHAAAALVIVVAAVFHPIVGFEFVDLDTAPHVINNPHIRGLTLENLTNILTRRWITSYRPMRSLSYAIDYQFWGLNPAGFELTNGLIHATNVLLVFWLILRFFVWPTRLGDGSSASTNVLPAALATAVFAIHPVVVEPVAWVSGREELLMTLGGLACVHFHLTARQLASCRGRASLIVTCHALAVLTCVAACLSNAVGAVIPLLILVIDLLILPKPALRQILTGAGPLMIVGVLAVAIKKIEDVRDPPGEVAAMSLERLTMIFNSYYLNLKTLVWPTDLAVFYPRLSPSGFTDTQVILGMAMAAITATALWWLRREKFVVLGLLWFLLALAPTSQVMVHHIHRADRFLYLPLTGLAVAIAFALQAAISRLPGRVATTAVAVPAVIVLLAAARLSAAQVWTWQDGPSMWANCVKVSPENHGFRLSFADCLAGEGQARRAVQEYETVLRSDPDHQLATIKLARLLATSDDHQIRDPQRAFLLAQRMYERNPFFFREVADVRARLAECQAAAGQFSLAIEGYRYALDLDPGNELAGLQLALLLATCRDERLRDPLGALQLVERHRLLDESSRPGNAKRGRPEGELPGGGFSTARQILEATAGPADTRVIEDLRRRLRSWVEAHP